MPDNIKSTLPEQPTETVVPEIEVSETTVPETGNLANEMMLFDRIEKLKQLDAEHNLNENAYISFSGGKDSTVLHYLVDEALPGNKIPRVYSNTGIEYREMVKFVKSMQKEDDRIQIIPAGVNIRKMLRENGFPFKSKKFSNKLNRFYKSSNRAEIIDEIEFLEDNTELILDYEYISILPQRVKWFVKVYFGLSEHKDKRTITSNRRYGFPQTLKYLIYEDFNISDKCCFYLKKQPLNSFKDRLGKQFTLTGMRRSEGGNRANIGCLSYDRGDLSKIHILAPVTDDWIAWYIESRNIRLCPLYLPPYNLVRTGCKGCPYALNLKNELNAIAEHFPSERKQCQTLFGNVYDEYERIGYRLPKKRTNTKDTEEIENDSDGSELE